MDRRRCTGIKNMRKDFLQYELAIRRLPTEGAVPELKERLRDGLDSPVVVSPEIIGDVAATVQNISKTLCELERDVKFLEISNSNSKQFDRVRDQLNHLKIRLIDLMCLELDNALSQSVDKLIDDANILQIRALKIRRISLRLVREKKSAGSDGLGTRPESGELDNALSQSVDRLIDDANILQIREDSLVMDRTEESARSGGLGTRPGIGELALSQSVDNLKDYGNLMQVRADSLRMDREEDSAESDVSGTRPGSSEPDDALSQSVDHLKDYGNILQVRADSLGMEREEDSAESDESGTRPGSSDVCANVSHSSSPQYDHFAKLPDSIMCLLNCITELSASSVNCIQQLLWLLVRFEQQTIEVEIPHDVFLSLLLPLTVDDLRSLLSDALKEGFSIEQFRQIVIAKKLSPCMRNELEQRFFWRVQEPQESLSDYVERIWTVVLAIVMNISEGEIISHILEGMHPDYQSRLALFDRPSTLKELQRVVESIEALAITDRQRQEAESAS